MAGRQAHLLTLCVYAALTVGGMGLHLLESAPETDCAACHGGPQGATIQTACGTGPHPCQDPVHRHHDHPVHQHEDGCVACTTLATQILVVPAPMDDQVQEAHVSACPVLTIPARAAVPRPPDRAPPTL